MSMGVEGVWVGVKMWMWVRVCGLYECVCARVGVNCVSVWIGCEFGWMGVSVCGYVRGWV